MEWANPHLNPEQKSAVKRILSGEARPLPYIIYGPPGTGKTVTVVEAVLQLFLLRSDARILVATPSNSSADLIVERLVKSGKLELGDVARLNAFNRSVDSVPETVKPYCFVSDDVDVLAKVVRHRIVVSTCATSGSLFRLGLTRGHFTHCVIDEAGETTEPEAMVPICLLGHSKDTQIVLAGDPKQLGPVLQHPTASELGLETSYLERLSRNPLYERDPVKFRDFGCYDPVLCTKLVRNYRSHADILSVSSQLFYDSELRAFAARGQRQTQFLNWTVLPNPQSPLVFHGVRGKNFQEPDSPSWFNPAECLQVARYLGQILDSKLVEINEVGIVSPYKKQTLKLKEILESLNLPVPKIGSVEEFQGQERPVIIVTTVRTLESENYVESDVIRGLGFLRSEKRFNVAITRAMSLLIVIGDPHLLGADPTWSCFIHHCLELNAYVGCDLPNFLSK